MTQGGDIDRIGVFGVDAHAAYVTGAGEAEVGPGLALVGGLVDAVAVGDVAAKGGFTHAHVDDVGVGLGDGYSADGAGLEVAVGYVLPEHASVVGLPDAAAAASEVERGQVTGVTGHGDNAASPERPDTAPFQRLKQ